MKKIISILLIITIASPLWLFFSILRYEKHCLKKEIKKSLIAGIDRNELVLLKFSAEEIKTKLKWEHSKEFEYQNEMYDIVESETKNDSVYYWCWWDYEETQLNKKLDMLVKHASGMDQKNTEHAKRVTNFFSSFFTQKIFDVYNFDPAGSKAIFPNCFLNYTSRNTTPDTPPPKS